MEVTCIHRSTCFFVYASKPLQIASWDIQGHAVTAAPDDRNRLTVLRDGVTRHASPPQANQITALQLNKGNEDLTKTRSNKE